MKLELSSPAFADGTAIPRPYTSDGKNNSPPLRWSNPPEKTMSFALVCEDPDAPRGTWIHWVLFNLPAGTKELPEGIPAKEILENDAKQGKNTSGTIGYTGPAPPRGDAPHRYYFKLYALDTKLHLPAGATKDQLASIMKDHIVAEGQIMGRYGR